MPAFLSRAARTRIKICGLTREADVDAAVEAGADAIGFVLWSGSARHVTLARAAELARRLPPFVMPVGLFVNATPPEIDAACSTRMSKAMAEAERSSIGLSFRPACSVRSFCLVG